MIRRKKFNAIYWQYYILLEQKVLNTFQYVELSVDNGSTYSNEYASLLMTIGAEVDTLFKLNCGIQADETRKSIADYCRCLLEEVKEIEVKLLERDYSQLKPFLEWNETSPAKSLKWWDAYNKIKHSRGNNRKYATQKNVVYALAALCILEHTMLRRIAAEYGCMNTPSEYSKLFCITDWEYNAPVMRMPGNEWLLDISSNSEEDRALRDAITGMGWEKDVFEVIPEE